MATHFEPHVDDDDYIERTSCGVETGEQSTLTGKWSDVTCKRCLRMKDRLQSQCDKTEEIIVQQMGEMAAHFEAHN